MNPASGRFWTADSYEGDLGDPPSLHKYLYANSNPIGFSDPTGHMSVQEAAIVSAVVGILVAMSAIIVGQLNYRTYNRLDRGNLVHKYIYPFYEVWGFKCNKWIGTTANPPIDPLRPDCRDEVTGEVYEIKSSDPGQMMDGLNDLYGKYIPHLIAHSPHIPWHPGSRNLVVPPELRLFEFPYIVFRISVPEPGLIIYDPQPDYLKAAEIGAIAAVMTLMALSLRMGPNRPPLEELEPALAN